MIDDIGEQKGFCEMIINQETDEIIGLNMIDLM